jgi:hypothetical protein
MPIPLLLVALSTPAEAPLPRLEFAFSELVTLAPDVTPGRTAYGERNIVPITGGTFEGPGIRGTILPGGWDWQLRRADGCLDIKADYMIRTNDGVVINVVNKGALCRPAAGAPPAPGYTSPVFEAPTGRYDWLSKNAFVGTLEPSTASDGSRAVKISFFRVR